MNFVAPSEHQVLVFLVQVVVLLAMARLLGQLARRFGQPTVVGELAAGVLIGPSVFGRIAPEPFEWLFPNDTVQSGMLFTVGWLGVMMLLVATGFETDLGLISRLGRAAVLVTIGSLTLPFLFGLGSGFVAPTDLIGEDSERIIFALFLAAALTISSLPVIAKILSELELLRRNFGQLTLAVGMANDVIGWVVLGLIAGIASSGAFDVRSLLWTVGWLVAFLGAAVVFGQRLVDAVMRSLRRNDVGVGGFITVAIGFALAAGSITQAIGVEAVLGAFIAGILLGRSRYAMHEAEEHLETVTTSFLAPIFFATAGLRVDLSSLAEPIVVWWALIILAVASVAKFVGSWAGARAAGLGNRDGMALGAALNARGALEIVIATVGLSLGVLNDASYTIIVLMAIATSMMASPLLRAVTHNWQGSPDEVIRLKREKQLAESVMLRPTRVLFLANGDRASAFAAEITGAALPAESPFTIMRSNSDPVAMFDVMNAVQSRDHELRTTNGGGVAELLRQAGMGYGLFVTGTDATTYDDLTETQTAMLVQSPLPVLLARPPKDRLTSLNRIMLPLSTTLPSRGATELAIALAGKLAIELDLLYVRSPADDEDDNEPSRLSRVVRSGDPVAQNLFTSVASSARDAGIWPRRVTYEHASRGIGIIEAARQRSADLVVIGVEAQDVAGTVHLGRTATHLLSAADIGLLIVALGPR